MDSIILIIVDLASIEEFLHLLEQTNIELDST